MENGQKTPPVTVTRGSDMTVAFLKGFGGGAMQTIGGLAAVYFICRLVMISYAPAFMLEGDENLLPRTIIYLTISVIACIYGAYLRYQSKQTVMIAGVQTTTEKQ